MADRARDSSDGLDGMQAMHRMPARRTVLAAAGAALLPAFGLLGGCGFHLRSSTALPFHRLALVGAAASTSVGQELRRQLGGRVQFVERSADAQAVLTVETATREKIVSGLTSTGLVRELVLRLRFRFRLSTPGGRQLIGATDLLLQRDMSTNETAALAKAREEDEIFRVLERDVVLQMIRHLEALPASALEAGG